MSQNTKIQLRSYFFRTNFIPNMLAIGTGIRVVYIHTATMPPGGQFMGFRVTWSENTTFSGLGGLLWELGAKVAKVHSFVHMHCTTGTLSIHLVSLLHLDLIEAGLNPVHGQCPRVFGRYDSSTSWVIACGHYFSGTLWSLKRLQTFFQLVICQRLPLIVFPFCFLFNLSSPDLEVLVTQEGEERRCIAGEHEGS